MPLDDMCMRTHVCPRTRAPHTHRHTHAPQYVQKRAPLMVLHTFPQVSPLPPMDLSKIPEALHDPRKMQGLLAAIGEFFGGAIGPDPLQTVVDAFTTDAVKTLSPASWVKVIATYNQGVATFWPGRYSK